MSFVLAEMWWSSGWGGVALLLVVLLVTCAVRTLNWAWLPLRGLQGGGALRPHAPLPRQRPPHRSFPPSSYQRIRKNVLHLVWASASSDSHGSAVRGILSNKFG
ncbi:unnamed protein product, partial [Musa acuminata var. zebrina]